MIPPHPSAFFFWQRLHADYAGMARVFKLQYETVPLQGVLRFRSAEPESKMGAQRPKWWISRTGAERTFGT
jgi:hypothetical protein